MKKCALVIAMAAVLVVVLKPHETEARMTMAQLRNAMKGVAKTCIGKTGVDPAVASDTKNGVFPVDRPLSCYFLCLYGGMKVVKDGRLNIDSMYKQVDMMMPLDMIDKVKNAIGKCNGEATSDDDCQRMWDFSKCYYEVDPTIWFFP